VATVDDDALSGRRLTLALSERRSLARCAEIAQDLGDAAHADAPDPTKMDGSDLARAVYGFIPLCRVLDALVRHGRDRGFPSLPGAAARANLQNVQLHIGDLEFGSVRFAACGND